MSTPAVRQVQIALAAQITAVTGRPVIVDRTDDEPLANDERPALVLHVGGQAFEAFDQSSTIHAAQFDLDILEDSEDAGSIQLRHAVAVAAIVAAVHADRTLGGRLQSLEEKSADPSNADTADLGNCTLSFAAQYLTPRGDFNTIVGQSGLFT